MRRQAGQTTLTVALFLVALVVAAVWIWKRIPPDTQAAIIDQALPVAGLAAGGLVLVGWGIRKIRRRRHRRQERDRLIGRFKRTQATSQRLDLAFSLIELNGYQPEGLEEVAPAMTDLLTTTLKTALGDKQHRLRGMAASHLGALRSADTIPLLVAALDDDHAYVRASAALALGRLRASEAKARLTQVMQDDWDQTVRSRAREALERIP